MAALDSERQKTKPERLWGPDFLFPYNVHLIFRAGLQLLWPGEYLFPFYKNICMYTQDPRCQVVSRVLSILLATCMMSCISVTYCSGVNGSLCPVPEAGISSKYPHVFRSIFRSTGSILIQQSQKKALSPCPRPKNVSLNEQIYSVSR